MLLKIIIKLLGNKECTLKKRKKRKKEGGEKERKKAGKTKKERKKSGHFIEPLQTAWFLHIYSNVISAVGYLGRNLNYFFVPKIDNHHVFFPPALSINESK